MTQGRPYLDDSPPDKTPPEVTLSGMPTKITRHDLLQNGIRFKEDADERVTFDNDLLASPRGLGQGKSKKFNVRPRLEELLPFECLPT